MMIYEMATPLSQSGNNKTPLFYAAMNNKVEMFTNQVKLGTNIEANTTNTVFLCKRYSL